MGEDMTLTVPDELDVFFTENAARARAELFDFLRIPSVSTRAEHRSDVQRAAEWLAGSLCSAGLSAAGTFLLVSLFSR